jgi:hypothetical protein
MWGKRRAVRVPARGAGPRTVPQILDEASREMDERDLREAQAADPLAYLGLPRRRLSDQFRIRR